MITKKDDYTRRISSILPGWNQRAHSLPLSRMAMMATVHQPSVPQCFCSIVKACFMYPPSDQGCRGPTTDQQPRWYMKEKSSFSRKEKPRCIIIRINGKDSQERGYRSTYVYVILSHLFHVNKGDCKLNKSSILTIDNTVVKAWEEIAMLKPHFISDSFVFNSQFYLPGICKGICHNSYSLFSIICSIRKPGTLEKHIAQVS